MVNVREIRGAGLGAVVVAAYMALVLMSGRVDPVMFGRLTAAYLGVAFALWFILGFLFLLFQIVRGARRSGSEPFLARLVASLVSERWQRDYCISLLWPPLLFALLIASFNAFKQMVLPLAGFGLDPLFAAADRALFLGNDPWRITHALLGSPQAILMVDRAYHGWFVPMSVGLILCAWLPRAAFRLRTQYMLSYIGVWIGIGSILAFLLPSAGPCYFEHFTGPHPSFHELAQRLRDVEAATGAPLHALSNQAMLLKFHGSSDLLIGGGISAMPSVHNALAVLFAIAAYQLNRAAGWLLGFYAVLIWIGSIHLGWHYALDGLVGAALTYCIWIICGRIAVAIDRDATATMPAAALL